MGTKNGIDWPVWVQTCAFTVVFLGIGAALDAPVGYQREEVEMRKLTIEIKGKAGAGKSTIAQNIASDLRRQGMQVSLHDEVEITDISSPRLIEPAYVHIVVVSQ